MTTATAGLMPSRKVLGNGAVVVTKETSTTPAVAISAAFKGGTFYDPPELVGLSHFVSRTIDRGTAARPADVIAEELDCRGVSLNVSVTRHSLTLTCNCLSEDFESMLELLGDIAMNAVFPPEEVETRRGEILTAIRQDEDNPAVKAVEGLLALLYPGGHPYGRRSKGDAKTVQRIDRAALGGFHKERFKPSSLTLVIVGDVQAERAAEEASRVFSNWAAGPAEDVDVPPVRPPVSRQQLIIPMMNKAQTDIAYGFVGLARHDPWYHPFLIMNHTLGQHGLGGRLGESIRERQGMAYYVFSTFDAGFAPGPLVVRAGVSPANVERAVASIDEELTRLAGEGLSLRELAEAKQYLVGSLPRILETNAGIATFLQTVETFGLGLDYDIRLPGLLNEVTLEQVNEMARRFLVPERGSVVIAGPYSG
jgi:zinc protease